MMTHMTRLPRQKLPLLGPRVLVSMTPRARTMITHILRPRLAPRARTMITHILRPRITWRTHPGNLLMACFLFLNLHVFSSSSIWKCQILNIKYLLLFSAGRRSGKNQNKYSNFKIRHVQIDELQRTLFSIWERRFTY